MPSEKHARSADFHLSPSATSNHTRSDDAYSHPGPSRSSAGSHHLASLSNSGAARKKVIGAGPRTGQACDRCKSRKIRCDDTPGGCLPCRQLHAECKTTDRITHRATARGHTEVLERDVASLREHVARLEKQLRENGSEIDTAAPQASLRQSTGQDSEQQTSASFAWESRTSAPGATVSNGDDKALRREVSESRTVANSAPLPPPRLGRRLGENYLGVSPADGFSPVKGLALTLFNMTIDLGDCIPQDGDDPLNYWMTYEAINRSVAGWPHSQDLGVQATLPTYEECCMYYGFWVSNVQPCLPLLHRPDFEALLKRVYEGAKTTVAEDVTVHMMLAFLKLQGALRNGMTTEAGVMQFKVAMAHLHFSLSKYNQLIVSRTLADMTAAVMICCTLRSFPRPGGAWTFMDTVLTFMVELGLHRSNKAWAKEDGKHGILEIEQRKRVFWSLFMCHVVLSGKLGRPMPLRLEDYDIEIPEPLNENLVKAEPGPDPSQCSFYIAIEYFKLTELFLETYSSIYVVRQSSNFYDSTVRDLDWKIRKWKRDLPPILADTGTGVGEFPSTGRQFGLWLGCWYSELLLLVHHPGLCKSKSSEVLRHNIEVSGEAASKLIQTVIDLWSIKAYDTTWYNLTTFFAAILTRLFVVAERTDRVTEDDLARVQYQNDQCLNIISDIGDLLGPGTGDRIRTKLEQILSQGVERIKRKLSEKNGASIPSTSNARTATALLSQTQFDNQKSSTMDYVTTPLSSIDPSRPLEHSSTLPPRSNVWPPPTKPPMPHPSYSQPPSRSNSHQSPRPAAFPSPRYTTYSPRSGSYPSPRPAPYPSPRHGPYHMSYPPQVAPAYHYVYPPDPHAYGVPHVAVHPDAYMLPPGAHAYGGNYNSQGNWRQWIETTGRADAYDYMPPSALVALNGHEQGPESTTDLPYSGPMPPNPMSALIPDHNDHASLAQQEWPGSTYDPPRYSVLLDGSLRAKE